MLLTFDMIFLSIARPGRNARIYRLSAVSMCFVCVCVCIVLAQRRRVGGWEEKECFGFSQPRPMALLCVCVCGRRFSDGKFRWENPPRARARLCVCVWWRWVGHAFSFSCSRGGSLLTDVVLNEFSFGQCAHTHTHSKSGVVLFPRLPAFLCRISVGAQLVWLGFSDDEEDVLSPGVGGRITSNNLSRLC